MPDFEAIAAAFKRINNILKQAREKNLAISSKFEYRHDVPHEERLLAAKAERLAPRFQKAFAERDYADALVQLSTLREDVDTFFDKVMVMVDDEAVRANRLHLLKEIQRLFLEVADLSRLPG